LTGPVAGGLVYGELRQVAARNLADETPGQTLQPTALVHEAYRHGTYARACLRAALRPADP
jgi:hypothetical protein